MVQNNGSTLMELKMPFSHPEIFMSDVFAYLKNPISPEQFRHALEERWQTPNIQMTKTARQAIWLILSSLDPPPASEVIVSSFMCPVVPLAVIKAGCRPVFCDVIPEGFVISPEDASLKITSKTIAIIMPYSFGCYSDIDSFRELAYKHNLVLIEDCAQTLEGKYRNKRLGFNADFGFWSFGISKNIGSLNGGAFWYHDRHKKRIEKNAKKMSDVLKINHSHFDIFRAAGVPLINSQLGYSIISPFLEKYQQRRDLKRSSSINTSEFDGRMSNLEATLCFLQLKRYQIIYERRKNNYDIYKKKLGDLMNFPREIPDFSPDYLYAPVCIRKELRTMLLNKFSFVSDINFSYLDRIDLLTPFPFKTVNREKVQEEYLLLSIQNSERQTGHMADLLKSYLNKINESIGYRQSGQKRGCYN